MLRLKNRFTKKIFKQFLTEILMVAILCLMCGENALFIRNVKAFANEEDIYEIPTITAKAHVQKKGWLSGVSSGEIIGTTGESLRIEAIKLSVNSNELSGEIEYKSHVQKIGWQDYVSDGEMSGTSGRALRLEAVSIRLTGELADYFDVYYSCHVQSFGWLGWVKNGEVSGSSGYSKRMEALKIIIVRKGDTASIPTSDVSGYFNSKDVPVVAYTSHMQSYGWMDYVTNRKVSGVIGKSKRMEAINMLITSSKGYSGSIQYAAHVQTYGWTKMISNNLGCGTVGKGLRVEGIKIELTGDISNYYDIYYRAYSQKFGWLGWAKNGAPAGTSGYGYRLEGYQVVIVHKNAGAPGSTKNSFVSKKITAPSSPQADEVIRLVNVERAKYGLAPLKKNAVATNAANKRAMECKTLFDHTRPDGTAWNTILTEFNIDFAAAGENLAEGYPTAAEVVEAWMNSAGHRANILESSFTSIGVGYYVYNGYPYWSQLFIG